MVHELLKSPCPPDHTLTTKEWSCILRALWSSDIYVSSAARRAVSRLSHSDSQCNPPSSSKRTSSRASTGLMLLAKGARQPRRGWRDVEAHETVRELVYESSSMR